MSILNILKREPSAIRQSSFRNNLLLAALPLESYKNLLPHLLSVYVERGDILYEHQARSKYVYFPTTSMMSLIYDLADGFSAEVAVIGREGVVGDALLMGGGNNSCHVIAQTPGGAFRIKAEVIQGEFDKGNALQHLLLLHIQAQLTQISQTVACNRHHSIEQQLCRWLLLCLERSPSNQLFMTHERIANNLGVRRESVTTAAHTLQSEKLIHYQRGLITVLDRSRLEARACECYAVVKREYDRLMPANTFDVNEPERRNSKSPDTSSFERRHKTHSIPTII